MARSAKTCGVTLKQLLQEALLLKELDRSGWKRVGVENPESVAAHTWGMCWLILVLAPHEIDQLRALKLAIIHDLAEARVGDITPHDGVSKSEKSRRETTAATNMLANRPDLLALWNEYNECTTPEAKFVHDVDRLDMALQAIRYGNFHNTDTSEFLVSAQKDIHDERLLALFARLVQT